MKFINILTKLIYPIRKERFVMKIYNVIILDKRRKKNVSQVLIQYDGFSDTPPKWINETDLITL